MRALTGGCWEDVVDLAMGGKAQSKSIKGSTASEALEDSYVEILKNAVDEVIAKHFGSASIIKPEDTLKAILVVSIDDKTNPENVVVSCVDNGRGFTDTFLHRVDTLENRIRYTHRASSEKIPAVKSPSDIPLYTGGQGQGLRMLIRKIEEGTYVEDARSRATMYYKAPVSEIKLSNILDSSGKVAGAVITVTTSKQPVIKAKPQSNMVTPEKETMTLEGARHLMSTMKLQNKTNQDQTDRVSPISIDTDEFDDIPKNHGDDNEHLYGFSPVQKK